MSLTNFEEITEDLTEAEKKIAVSIFNNIKKNYVGKNNACKASKIVEAYRNAGKPLTDVRIRKMVNWLRCNGFPICSGSVGYYFPSTKAELEETIQSLEERVRQIQRSITGIKTAINKF